MVLECFGGVKCFGRRERGGSLQLVPVAQNKAGARQTKVKSDTFSHAQTSKQTSPLSSSPSAPEPSSVFQHLTQQRCLLTPAAQPAPSPLPPPSSAPRQCLQNVCTHTHHHSSDPLLFFRGSAVMSLQNMKAEQ